jgi:DNA replication protein DnaC
MEPVTMECEKHGPYSSQSYEVFGKVFQVGCPKCMEEQEAKELAENDRAMAALENDRMKAMNVEPEYFHASLENFQSETPEQGKNLETVRRLVSGQIRSVIMTGTNGTGKTHLACAALKVLGGKIFSMYEISATIRASYTPLARRTELEIVDELARVPLLVIDEVGRTKGSDTETNWLSYIIDKRHARRLPIIIISNKHVRKACPENGCPNCLENYISEDIMSRLVEGGVLLRFDGEDWRRRRR